MKRNPDKVMEQMLETHRQRGASYAPNGRQGNEVHAALLTLLFPDGVKFNDEQTAQRFVLLNYIIGKLVRYSLLLDRGGHQDSIHDIAVYAAILDAYHEVGK